MLCDKDDDSEEYILWLLVTSFLILWVIPGPTFNNTDIMIFIWSLVCIRLGSVHFPHYQMVFVLFLQTDDLPAKLETVCSTCLHMNAKIQVLQEEFLSMKEMQKRCEKLEKNKKKLEQEVVNLKSHIELNMIEHSQVEHYKQEVEERVRQDLIEKLREVNMVLQVNLLICHILEFASLWITFWMYTAYVFPLLPLELFVL